MERRTEHPGKPGQNTAEQRRANSTAKTAAGTYRFP
jgi:hypothetical protein